MNKIITLLVIMNILNANDTIQPVSLSEQNQMRGVSYHSGCPISLDDLRLVSVKYLGFDGSTHVGILQVNKIIADEVVLIFDELYDIKYPVKQIAPIGKYKGSDYDSIEADNTSAFNCRFATGNKRYSLHAHGRAIDINPIENPYVFSNGRTSHKASIRFLNRFQQANTPESKAILTKDSDAVKIFKKYGWRWGGDWATKDYQHFEKSQ